MVCHFSEKDCLLDGQIATEYPGGRIVIDEIDPDYSYGATAIGFEYRSKLTGNIVILHPAQLKYLTYRKPTKKE
jgi:hypothetical protein